MAKTCVTESSARRQRWIENGLLEMMLIHKYEDITVTDLCAHLELSRRSFYRYFRDLEDVLESLLDHAFQDMAIPDRLLGIPEMQRNFEYWHQHRQLLEALERSSMMDKLFEFTRRYTSALSIHQHLAPDDLGMDIRREAGLFAVSGSVALAIAWYQDGFRKTPEQMARIAYRLLVQPILKKT